jgi:hypothetical protein
LRCSAGPLFAVRLAGSKNQQNNEETEAVLAYREPGTQLAKRFLSPGSANAVFSHLLKLFLQVPVFTN